MSMPSNNYFQNITSSIACSEGEKLIHHIVEKVMYNEKRDNYSTFS